MICVSIGRGRHRHMIAEHRHLVQQGAELVELRLDYINGEVNLQAAAGRPAFAGGHHLPPRARWRQVHRHAKRQRLMLLRAAIAEGVEYVDLEDDVAATIPRFGKTKRIISLHDFRKTPDDLDEIHARLAALDADIVKIATMANQPHDNLRMLQLVQEREGADGRHVHGRHRHAVADPGRPLRRAVHVRHVPPRADAWRRASSASSR